MKKVTFRIKYKIHNEADAGTEDSYCVTHVTNEVPDGWLDGLKQILGSEGRGYVGDCYCYYFQMAVQKDYYRNHEFNKDIIIKLDCIEIVAERDTEKGTCPVSLEYSYESDYYGMNEKHRDSGCMLLPEDMAHDLADHTGQWEHVQELVCGAIEKLKSAKNIELTDIEIDSLQDWEFCLLEVARMM